MFKKEDFTEAEWNFIKKANKLNLMWDNTKDSLQSENGLRAHMILALETENIDFKCNINKKGLCRYYTTNKCCCHSCLNSIGHYYKIPKSFLKILVPLWSDVDGFWEYGIGCKIPRKYRSGICLAHSCTELTNKDKTIILALSQRFI